MGPGAKHIRGADAAADRRGHGLNRLTLDVVRLDHRAMWRWKPLHRRGKRLQGLLPRDDGAWRAAGHGHRGEKGFQRSLGARLNALPSATALERLEHLDRIKHCVAREAPQPGEKRTVTVRLELRDAHEGIGVRLLENVIDGKKR